MGPAGDEVLVVGLLVKIVGEGLGAVDAAEFEAVGLGGGVWFCQCLFYPVGREGGLTLVQPEGGFPEGGASCHGDGAGEEYVLS